MIYEINYQALQVIYNWRRLFAKVAIKLVDDAVKALSPAEVITYVENATRSSNNLFAFKAASDRNLRVSTPFFFDVNILKPLKCSIHPFGLISF